MRFVAACLSVIVVVSGTGGCALPTSSPLFIVDPQAREVLQDMCETLSGTHVFRVSASDIGEEMLPTGQLAEYSSRLRTVLVRRPDHVFVDRDGDLVSRRLWYDGSTLSLYDVKRGAYATQEFRGDIDSLVDYIADEFDVDVPLTDFIVSDPCGSLTRHAQSGQYLGLHRIGDRRCHHLVFEQESVEWQIWIDAEGEALPRRLVISYKELPGQPQYVADFDSWDLAPEMPQDVFLFHPPADASRVEMEELLDEE